MTLKRGDWCDMTTFRSEYHEYRELVWRVVGKALEVGFQTSFDTVLSFGISTRNEILDIAGVSLEDYRIDCMEHYIKEIEILKHMQRPIFVHPPIPEDRMKKYTITFTKDGGSQTEVAVTGFRNKIDATIMAFSQLSNWIERDKVIQLAIKEDAGNPETIQEDYQEIRLMMA